ncbi:Phospholipid metabolism enzyme regulator [Scedosporium apiospermum]|uniref:Phospholipid metabolism enzyme regulator n=1 Tax=Pseudallescheria apiosperma TaxID=563466 RepID=A0A084FUA7_PSEDA|nr:Phospholipid metabolism enzyme regulator [Scedosporium apiospermum]KEZ38669.1 Phospholipid metabolism enzyme regulator [Scedosporium apiospermum]
MDKSANRPGGTSTEPSHSSTGSRSQLPSPQPVSVSSSTSLSEQMNQSKQSSTNNSVAPSPLGSRDPSPIRLYRQSTTTQPSFPHSRSRKNSVVDTSPTRVARSGLPQGHGNSRTLTAANTPALPPASQEPNVRGPTPQKPATSDQTRSNSPRWPISPRLRSPPPQLNRASIAQSIRANETPSVILPRGPTATLPPPSTDQAQMSESETEDIQLQSGLRTPAHGSTLETVQEVSLPNSPKHITDAAMEQVKEKLASELVTQTEGGYTTESKTLRARPLLYTAESGSESGSVKVEGRRTAGGITAPPMMSRQSSSMSTKAGKTKPEGSTQNMTVETETVISVPNVALAPAGPQGGNGTLRTRPSAETIKPKKEKKKGSRKQPAGAASSKAEIFEAKVASAVDEADDSDSEETFVYDSNPPDDRRRFHSRTPSATSMMSQAERAAAMRSIHSVMESAGPPVSVRKNMKFASTINSSTADSLAQGEDDNKGVGRSSAGSGRGTARHHHHIGRWGRSGHPSLFDNESPFPAAQRTKFSRTPSKQSSAPPSPRNYVRSGTNGKRAPPYVSNNYDLDDTTGPDDERTPLIFSSSRSYRSTRGRRGPISQRQLESQSYHSPPSYLNRLAACLVVTMMVLLVVTGAISFMFATSQPLTNIELTGIHNVIASEPELMFDLTVKAHNPNIVVVTIDNANLEIFAKSIHAGSDSEWWKHPQGPPDGGRRGGGSKGDKGVHISDDPPTDMPDDDAAPNMRLGTITEFDSPLSFEGSFFHKGMSSSTGAMRLHLPGNQTAGGSERWGRILQDEFDLVIKGIVKYNLPLSQKTRTASISGRTTVKPNSANDPSLKPNSTRIDIHPVAIDGGPE